MVGVAEAASEATERCEDASGETAEALAVALSVAPRAIASAPSFRAASSVLRACVALSAAGAERSPRRVAEARDSKDPGSARAFAERVAADAAEGWKEEGRREAAGSSAAARRSAALWTALAALAVQADGVAVGALGARLGRVEAAEVFLRASLEASNGSERGAFVERVLRGLHREKSSSSSAFFADEGRASGSTTNGDPGTGDGLGPGLGPDRTRSRPDPVSSDLDAAGAVRAVAGAAFDHLRSASSSGAAKSLGGALGALGGFVGGLGAAAAEIRAGYHARGRETVVANDGASLRRDDPGSSEASGAASSAGFPPELPRAVAASALADAASAFFERATSASDADATRAREILALAPEFPASSDERDERNASDGAAFRRLRALRDASVATTLMLRFGVDLAPGGRGALRPELDVARQVERCLDEKRRRRR